MSTTTALPPPTNSPSVSPERPVKIAQRSKNNVDAICDAVHYHHWRNCEWMYSRCSMSHRILLNPTNNHCLEAFLRRSWAGNSTERKFDWKNVIVWWCNEGKTAQNSDAKHPATKSAAANEPSTESESSAVSNSGRPKRARRISVMGLLLGSSSSAGDIGGFGNANKRIAASKRPKKVKIDIASQMEKYAPLLFVW